MMHIKKVKYTGKGTMNEITLGFDTIIDLETFIAKWRSGSGLDVDGVEYVPLPVNITMTVPIEMKDPQKSLEESKAREVNT